MDTTSRFLRACHGLPVDATPVWFMRQAGRYQPSYRALRQSHTLIDIVQDPELCAEVTCRPVEELGVDAAILFSDIMVPLGPIGVDYEIKEHLGPQLAHPIRTAQDIAALGALHPQRDLPFMLEAIAAITARLGPIPLIGFAGGPYTLASYMIEGGPSKDYRYTKGLMWTQPRLWNELMLRLCEVVGVHLQAQAKAGAQALMIFDSWIGSLAPSDYHQSIVPHMQRLIAELGSLQLPLIYFGVGTGELLPLMRASGPDVLGLDWRVPLDEARRRLDDQIVLQGNLDPTLLLADWPSIAAHTERILNEAAGLPHIFNLGHGVLPSTPPEVLATLTAYVHQKGQGSAQHH